MEIVCTWSSDYKSGVFAIIKAYEVLKMTGRKPSVNIKFFFEGEEEAGSINLEEIFVRVIGGARAPENLEWL